MMAGLFDYAKSKTGLLADALKRNATNLWGEIQSAPQDIANLFDPGFQQKISAQLQKPVNKNALKEQAVSLAMDTNPIGGLLGHTVYHGSPHKFSKFDMSKIGTGEGAQAYGHGLYFAEAPMVANEYAGKLSEPVIDFLNKTPETELEKTIFNKLLEEAKITQYGAKGDAVYSRWRNMAEPVKDHLYGNSYVGIKPLPPDQLAERLALRDAALGLGPPSVSDTGNLYKVDIPDESIPRFLDWDKPLSEQSESVRNALAKSKNKQVRAMLEYAQKPYSADIGGEAKTMGEAFRLLNLNLHGKSAADSAKASALLAKQGIPGIRYLDGNSRGAGQGSSNFVLFDDNLPRILEINGQPTGLTPWTPEEYADYLKKALNGL